MPRVPWNAEKWDGSVARTCCKLANRLGPVLVEVPRSRTIRSSVTIAFISYAPARALREATAITHDTALIATISIALTLALICGYAATRLGLPALVGYLLAGFLVGPSTPGFVADVALAPQLAELGVILLMFGVGIHFSLRDLVEMRKSALPGAFLKSAAITGLTVLITQAWGWSLAAGLVFGFALSVASTVVLLRALMDRDLLDSRPGRAGMT